MSINFTLESNGSSAETETAQPKEARSAGDEIVVQAQESKTKGRVRTLYRSPTDKMVAGVCGGLGDFSGWDPTLIRLFWVILTLATGGGGLLAYAALWILLPVGTIAGGQQAPATISLSERNLIRGAYVLIGLGIVWLLANVGILGSLWGVFWTLLNVFFWPALLIGVGYLLLRGTRRDLKEDFSNLRSKMQSNVNVNGKMPSSDEMKAGLGEARKRIPLKRSRTDRMLLGVCGGIGQRFGIDANLVRLIWAAFSIGSIGMGVLIYVAIGLLLPEEDALDMTSTEHEPQDVTIVDGTVNSTM